MDILCLESETTSVGWGFDANILFFVVEAAKYSDGMRVATLISVVTGWQKSKRKIWYCPHTVLMSVWKMLDILWQLPQCNEVYSDGIRGANRVIMKTMLEGEISVCTCRVVHRVRLAGLREDNINPPHWVGASWRNPDPYSGQAGTWRLDKAEVRGLQVKGQRPDLKDQGIILALWPHFICFWLMDPLMDLKKSTAFFHRFFHRELYYLFVHWLWGD